MHHTEGNAFEAHIVGHCLPKEQKWRGVVTDISLGPTLCPRRPLRGSQLGKFKLAHNTFSVQLWDGERI